MEALRITEGRERRPEDEIPLVEQPSAAAAAAAAAADGGPTTSAEPLVTVSLVRERPPPLPKKQKSPQKMTTFL
jgi:hypothetical protein